MLGLDSGQFSDEIANRAACARVNAADGSADEPVFLPFQSQAAALWPRFLHIQTEKAPAWDDKLPELLANHAEVRKSRAASVLAARRATVLDGQSH